MVGFYQQSEFRNELLYTGRRIDPATGLQLNRNRFYHQQLGRWVSRDPIGYRAGDMNLYGYVGEMPTYYVDPVGLDPKRPGTPPKDKPPGTKPINQHDDTKDKVHDIKDNLKEDNVGPQTWVGIDPEGNIIVPDGDGNPENLGPWEDYYHYRQCPPLIPPLFLPPKPILPPVPISPPPVPWWLSFPRLSPPAFWFMLDLPDEGSDSRFGEPPRA